MRYELAADGTVTDRLADLSAVELHDEPGNYARDLACHQIVARLVGLSSEELSEWLRRNTLRWIVKTDREKIASLERQANADPGNTRLQDQLAYAHQRFAEAIRDAGEVPGDQGYLQAALGELPCCSPSENVWWRWTREMRTAARSFRRA